MIFHRSRNKSFPTNLQVNLSIIPLTDRAKYLSIILDPKLEWVDYINFLRSRFSKYINILKWLVSRGWGFSLSQAINFVNAIIISQLLWGSAWFITHLNLISRSWRAFPFWPTKLLWDCLDLLLIIRAEQFPPNLLSNVKLLVIVTNLFLRLFIFKKSIISNRIKNISCMINNRQIPNNNIPFLILRWNKIEHLLIDLHKWNFHLDYEFLLRLRVHNINFDFSPGAIAKESGDPNKCFLQFEMKPRAESIDVV